MEDNYIAKDIEEKDNDLISEYHEKGKLHEEFLPFATFDMVQMGYPTADHGAMVARVDGGTDEDGVLQPSKGMWMKVQDFKDFLDMTENIIHGNALIQSINNRFKDGKTLEEVANELRVIAGLDYEVEDEDDEEEAVLEDEESWPEDRDEEDEEPDDSLPTDKIPNNLDEAIEFLTNDANKEFVEEAGDEETFVSELHMFFGMNLRNMWGLWKGSPLKTWFNERGIYHADDMSGIILTSCYRKFKGLEIDLDSQIKKYRDHWDKVDPKVNEGNI